MYLCNLKSKCGIPISITFSVQCNPRIYTYNYMKLYTLWRSRQNISQLQPGLLSQFVPLLPLPRRLEATKWLRIPFLKASAFTRKSQLFQNPFPAHPGGLHCHLSKTSALCRVLLLCCLTVWISWISEPGEIHSTQNNRSI